MRLPGSADPTELAFDRGGLSSLLCGRANDAFDRGGLSALLCGRADDALDGVGLDGRVPKCEGRRALNAVLRGGLRRPRPPPGERPTGYDVEMSFSSSSSASRKKRRGNSLWFVEGAEPDGSKVGRAVGRRRYRARLYTACYYSGHT